MSFGWIYTRLRVFGGIYIQFPRWFLGVLWLLGVGHWVYAIYVSCIDVDECVHYYDFKMFYCVEF